MLKEFVAVANAGREANETRASRHGGLSSDGRWSPAPHRLHRLTFLTSIRQPSSPVSFPPPARIPRRSRVCYANRTLTCGQGVEWTGPIERHVLLMSLTPEYPDDT